MALVDSPSPLSHEIYQAQKKTSQVWPAGFVLAEMVRHDLPNQSRVSYELESIYFFQYFAKPYDFSYSIHILSDGSPHLLRIFCYAVFEK